MKVIVCCDCGDTPAYARDAYSVLFSNDSEPKMAVGDIAIRALADIMKPGSEAADYIRGIAESKDRLAIYLGIDETGGITEAYNLFTGNRIQ